MTTPVRRTRGPRRCTAAGMTLVEMLVSVALAALLLGGAAMVTVNSKTVFRENAAYARVQDNSRFAIDLIAHDLRQAGFNGCVGGSTAPTNDLIATAGYQYNFPVGLQGFTPVSGAYSPALDSSISSLSHAPSNGTDVLTVRLPSLGPVQLTGAMSTSTSTLPISPSSGLLLGDTVLVGNCSASAIFEITADPSGGAVAHGATGLNATGDLGIVYSTDAALFRMMTRTYYVSASAVHPGLKSLWSYSVSNATAGAPQELVEGIDAIALLFGEDTNADGIPDIYHTASAVVNWSNVIDVRVQLLVSSPEDSVTASTSVASPVTFSLINGNTWTYSDGRLHKLVNSTISLRNRMS